MQKFSKEFKKEAISLSDEIGVKKAAQQLGMSYQTLADWRKTKNRKAEERKKNRNFYKINRRTSKRNFRVEKGK